MPVKPQPDFEFPLPGDPEATVFNHKLENQKDANIMHFDNQLYEDNIPGWGLNPPGNENEREESSEANNWPLDPKDNTQPGEQNLDPDILEALNLDANGKPKENNETEGNGETVAEGNGQTDPALLAKLVGQGVDPTLVAHLQRYANEVASGREPSPDLIEAIKGLLGAETDIDAKITELGIVGAKIEDPAMQAHQARYDAYKASGEDIPPDLQAIIDAAGNAKGETVENETLEPVESVAPDDSSAFTLAGGTAIVAHLRTLLTDPSNAEALKALADLGVPATFMSEPDLGTIARLLGAPASAAASDTAFQQWLTNAGLELPADFFTTPLNEADLVELQKAVALSKMENPIYAAPGGDSNGPADNATGVITRDDRAEIVQLLLDVLANPTDAKAKTALAAAGISEAFLQTPDTATVAKLLGMTTSGQIDETALRALFPQMPTDFFSGPLTEADLELLADAVEGSPDAQPEQGED